MEAHSFVSQIEHLPSIGIWYFPWFCQFIYFLIREGASEIVNQESELFSARAERYATSNYCSLSLSLSLSFHLHHKTRENWIWGQLQCFCSKRLTESRLGSPTHTFHFRFLPTLTICTEHEWTRVLVFLFSAQPPSFFVTLTTEAEWRGLGAGEHIGRHSGNTRNKHLDLCEDDTTLRNTTLTNHLNDW